MLQRWAAPWSLDISTEDQASEKNSCGGEHNIRAETTPPRSRLRPLK